MTSRSPQLLRVHYRCLQPSGFSALWPAGAETRDDRVQPDQSRWVAMTRLQWMRTGLEGQRLETALRQELQRCHPGATDVLVESVSVLRRGEQFLRW